MARLFVIFFCCGIYCVGWAMRICFLTNGNLSDQTADLQACGADVILCGFQALGEVSYERELRGETNLFEDVALLSKEAQNVVIGGCFTDSHSMRRKSVVVAERGRILGVSDMVNRIDGGAYRAGAGVKIYETKVGRLGVIVAEDIYFPRVGETLSACGAEIAINTFAQFSASLFLWHPVSALRIWLCLCSGHRRESAVCLAKKSLLIRIDAGAGVSSRRDPAKRFLQKKKK